METYSYLLGVASVFAAILLLVLLNVLYKILVPYVLLPPVDLKKKAGASWAVITGSTDGIGKSYSFELAKRGFNIYLVSRTPSKLELTKKEILKKHSDVEVRTAVFDFTNSSVADYEKLLKTLNEVAIGILVNNVGMLYEYPEILHKVEGGLKRLADIVVVNTLPPTLLSAGIIPQMVARKAGVVVNIGSASGAAPLAKWAVYSATKKYVSWLTEILREEYKNSGIIFQTITPFFVSTNMIGNPDNSFFCPNSDTFAESALNTIGNSSDTTGYINHQLKFEGMNLAPRFIIDQFLDRANTDLKDTVLAKKKETFSV